MILVDCSIWILQRTPADRSPEEEAQAERPVSLIPDTQTMESSFGPGAAYGQKRPFRPLGGEYAILSLVRIHRRFDTAWIRLMLVP